MTGEVESHRSRIIPIEHPERLMARLRGWDPVVDPFGTGLLRSFQCDMSSSFEPFTPPFTDTGYIRPQMLDNALFGYYTGNTAPQSEQENVSAENVPRQPQLYDLSLMSASGVTGYIKSVLTGSEEKPTAEQDDNHTMETVDLNSTQGTTQEISQSSKDKITGRRGTTYVDAIETISETCDLKSTQGIIQEISQGSTDKITAGRGTTYVDAKETISETPDTGSKIDKNNDVSAQGTSRQDNDVIDIGKDAVESGKRKESIDRDPDQTKNTGYMFDPTGVIPTPTGLYSMQHNTYEVLINAGQRQNSIFLS